MTDHSHIGLVIDSAEGPLFLISDIHAGALSANEDEFARQKLEELFITVRNNDGRLIILGDLFDYWQESGYKAPKQLQNWLELLERNQSPSKSTVLITGNHDHWVGVVLSNLGIVIVRDHVMLTTSGKPWLLLHGDGLPTDELKLVRRGLNKHFRNPLYNALFKLLPLGFRVAIMRAFSKYRKQRGHDPIESQLLDNHLTKWLRSHDYMGVVYGHTHCKMIQNLNGKYLANTGTFFTDGTVMIIEGTYPKMTSVDELKSTDSAKMTYIMPDGTRR